MVQALSIDIPSKDGFQVVLIIGAGSGLGHALSLHLCKMRTASGDRRFRVFATARKLEKMKDLAEEGVHIMVMDVCDDESVKTCMEEIHAAVGKIDYVIANAGITTGLPVVDQPLQQMQEVLNTNVLGVVRVIQAVAPGMMKEKKGVIMTIGSVSGYLITPYNGIYSGSKACMRSVTDCLRMELSPWGIKVIHVDMGAFKSLIATKGLPGLKLPPKSLYGRVQDSLRERFFYSNFSPGVMTAEDTAKQVAKAMMKKNPKYKVLAGGRARYYKFLAFLQEYVSPKIVSWKMCDEFSLSDLKKHIQGR